ncbi:MAG: phage antirepressor N-terminal domain-containing protein [Chloroflexales bacterium]
MSNADTGDVLTPEEIKTVDFYGDSITGALIRIEGELRIYVPLRPLTRFLGLNWSAQYRRALRDEILAPEIRGVAIMATPEDGNSSGGTQETLCLPLDLVPGWLFGLTTSKVKEEYREKITRYRRECYRRLWEAFAPSILPTLAPSPIERQPSGAQLAYELATAVQNLAREQMDLEQRLGGRIDRMAHWAKGVVAKIDDLDARVGGLELHVGPSVPISEQQAAEVALAVKNVGRALSERGTKPGYSQVYSELYRRYGISSYKNVPQNQYDEVLDWLKGWYDELTSETPT